MSLPDQLHAWAEWTKSSGKFMSPAVWISHSSPKITTHDNTPAEILPLVTAMNAIRSKSDSRADDVLTLQVHALYPGYGLSIRTEALRISQDTYWRRVAIARKLLNTYMEAIDSHGRHHGR